MNRDAEAAQAADLRLNINRKLDGLLAGLRSGEDKIVPMLAVRALHFCQSGERRRGCRRRARPPIAPAHGRASHPWLLSGYLGTSSAFDEAMGDFAVAYADQAERDHAAIKAAVCAGSIAVQIEDR